MKFILAILLFISYNSACLAREQITGFEEKDVAVLNEELRKNSDEINQSVKLSKDQTISGTKTFSSFPITPSSAPTSDYEVANKKYVDDNKYVLTDAAVTNAKLKTASGEVSSSSTSGTDHTLPGGEYGFYPQIKGAFNGTDYVGCAFTYYGTFGAYTTNIYLRAASGTVYAQQRYVTSSGTDYWLFVLIDENTNAIISAYGAPDHPAYGNGGDFNVVPHPFNNYDSETQIICLIDKAGVARIKQDVTTGRSLLTVLNEDYAIGEENLPYEPLHSGQFLNENGEQVKVMVTEIPNYIRVRTLIKNRGRK